MIRIMLASLSSLVSLSLSASALTATGPTSTVDADHEGDWYVSDTTNNHTGKREVYAFTSFVETVSADHVTVTMRCSEGKPIVALRWADLTFPYQTVLSIGPVATPDSEPATEAYVFERSDDPIEPGLRATPATSRRIIAAIGQAKYSTISAHLTPKTRTVGLNVDGTQRAWTRVSRHCPIQITARAPL